MVRVGCPAGRAMNFHASDYAEAIRLKMIELQPINSLSSIWYEGDFIWLNERCGRANWNTPVPKKDGTPGRRADQHFADYSPLVECGRCGLIRGKRHISYRHIPSEATREKRLADPFNTMSKMLCMSCWNKVRPVAKATIEAEKLKSLTNLLQREYRRAKREDNQPTKEST